jgi:hypothetical protein
MATVSTRPTPSSTLRTPPPVQKMPVGPGRHVQRGYALVPPAVRTKMRVCLTSVGVRVPARMTISGLPPDDSYQKSSVMIAA